MTTLSNERSAGQSMLGNRERGPMAQILSLWRTSPVAHRTPGLRDELLRCWVQNEVVQLTNERAHASSERGTPGPEVSLGKISGSLTQQWIYDLGSRIRGADALLIDNYDDVQRTELTQLINDGDLNKALLSSLATSIGGGTTQINKNVIAERVLGLPAEPRTDKAVPWNETKRS
jgi:alkylation response protein AidB-like acyl-CoA dehydrogenase